MTDWERDGAPRTDSGVPLFLQVGMGILLVFVLHALVGGLLFAAVWALGQVPGLSDVLVWAQMAGTAWMFGLSLVQLAYVLPVGGALWFVRRPITLGMAIGAGLTILLQGTCYALAVGVLGVGGL